jgi:hypothetical protein
VGVVWLRRSSRVRRLVAVLVLVALIVVVGCPSEPGSRSVVAVASSPAAVTLVSGQVQAFVAAASNALRA